MGASAGAFDFHPGQPGGQGVGEKALCPGGGVEAGQNQSGGLAGMAHARHRAQGIALGQFHRTGQHPADEVEARAMEILHRDGFGPLVQQGPAESTDVPAHLPAGPCPSRAHEFPVFVGKTAGAAFDVRQDENAGVGQVAGTWCRGFAPSLGRQDAHGVPRRKLPRSSSASWPWLRYRAK